VRLSTLRSRCFLKATRLPGNRGQRKPHRPIEARRSELGANSWKHWKTKTLRCWERTTERDQWSVRGQRRAESPNEPKLVAAWQHPPASISAPRWRLKPVAFSSEPRCQLSPFAVLCASDSLSEIYRPWLERLVVQSVKSTWGCRASSDPLLGANIPRNRGLCLRHAAPARDAPSVCFVFWIRSPAAWCRD